MLIIKNIYTIGYFKFYNNNKITFNEAILLFKNKFSLTKMYWQNI